MADTTVPGRTGCTGSFEPCPVWHVSVHTLCTDTCSSHVVSCLGYRRRRLETPPHPHHQSLYPCLQICRVCRSGKPSTSTRSRLNWSCWTVMARWLVQQVRVHRFREVPKSAFQYFQPELARRHHSRRCCPVQVSPPRLYTLRINIDSTCLASTD